MRLSIVAFVAACGSTQPAPAPAPAPVATPAPIAAPAPAAPAAATPAAPVTAPDGRDLPTPLVAAMFQDQATFQYTVYAYKVNKLGERFGGKHQVKCSIMDVVYMRELKALSARMACDERSPLEGVMFATRDGFWWYDTQRYVAGGFTLDESTKLFDREPKPYQDGGPGVKTVEQDKQGAWCWYERFERPPWQGQGLCFKDGRLISGWADNPAHGKTKGDYIEFKLVQ